MPAFGPIQPNPCVGVETRIDQSVGATAELISGITALSLDMNKQNSAWINANGDLRYAYDGTSPTTTSGHLLAAKSPLLVRGKLDILNFRFCGDGGSTVIVAITLSDSARGGGIV